MPGAPKTSARRVKEARFLAGPSSAVGRITLALFVAAMVALVLMATVVEPSRPPWRAAFGILIVVLVGATAVCGSIAFIVKRERSFAVVLPTVLCLAIVVNEVLQRAAVDAP